MAMHDTRPAANGVVMARGVIPMAVLIAVTALLGMLTTARYDRAGGWLPENVPVNIGVWEGVETPLGKGALALLGNPDAIARRYYSPFGEQVEASIVTAGKFENYHDPTVCVPSNGFVLSARKTFKMNGCNVRAMVFKKEDSQYGTVRMLMYYWQQTRDGQTDTAARMGSYRDIEARFKTGYGAVVQGKQTVLCRVYTFIMPEDTLGTQAQRNVEEISSALYKALIEDGKR